MKPPRGTKLSAQGWGTSCWTKLCPWVSRWDVNLEVVSSRGTVDHAYHRVDYSLDPGPARREEDYESDRAADEILLVLQVRVGGHHHAKPELLGAIQELAVPQRRPAELIRSRDVVVGEMPREGCGSALIE